MGNIVKFEGTFKWARTKNLDKFGKWSVQFYPKDDATRKAIKAVGFRVSLKEDDSDTEPNGMYYSFSRKSKAAWGDLEAPYVLDPSGDPITQNVGNGSKGWIVLDVYEYKGGVDEKGLPYTGGKAARWEGLEVTDLVIYERPTEDRPVAAAQNEIPF